MRVWCVVVCALVVEGLVGDVEYDEEGNVRVEDGGRSEGEETRTSVG